MLSAKYEVKRTPYFALCTLYFLLSSPHHTPSKACSQGNSQERLGTGLGNRGAGGAETCEICRGGAGDTDWEEGEVEGSTLGRGSANMQGGSFKR